MINQQECEWNNMAGGSVPFPFALYRFTASGDTEATIADTEAIGLDYGITETSDAGVVAFTHGVPQRRTDIPNVGSRKTTRPATTLVTVPITFTVAINEKTADQAAIQARFTMFSLQEQDVRGVFTEGRFGLRNDRLTGFPDINPTSMAGIRFVNYELNDMIEWTNHQIATVELEFVGDYTAYIADLEALA